QTPLHTAAYCGNLKILKILLDFYPDGADIRDNSGNNVYECLSKFHENAVGPLENMRVFRRFAILDKFDLSYPILEGSMNIWDIAMSSKITLLIANTNLENTRKLFSYDYENNKFEHIALDGSVEPRYIATSKTHSLVITDDQCFTWGKNQNGVLGFDTNEKVILSPILVEGDFVEYLDDLKSNIFDALDNRTRVIKKPLIGCSCSDDFNIVYTNERVFCWGINKGQMLGKAFKDEIVESPIVIYESQNNIKIRTVKCGENFIAILTTDGKLSLFVNGKNIPVGNGNHLSESVDANGNYLVTVTNKGKLVKVLVGDMGIESISTIWTPKTNKDSVLSYAVSGSGSVVLSTKSSTYKLQDNKPVNEQKELRGAQFTDLKCDTFFRKF
ncbi:hypothetical protein FF38_10336, partial [Lucilia cuprina]